MHVRPSFMWQERVWAERQPMVQMGSLCCGEVLQTACSAAHHPYVGLGVVCPWRCRVLLSGWDGGLLVCLYSLPAC